MNKESVVAEKIDRPSQNLLPIDLSLSDVDSVSGFLILYA